MMAPAPAPIAPPLASKKPPKNPTPAPIPPTTQHQPAPTTTTTSTSKTTTAANTTNPTPLTQRVRENQRRSRARRREYLHELETRLHAYERQGVQASTEVQAAAKRVLVENERLRGEVERLRGEIEMLRRGGVSMAGAGAGICAGGGGIGLGEVDRDQGGQGRKRRRGDDQEEEEVRVEYNTCNGVGIGVEVGDHHVVDDMGYATITTSKQQQEPANAAAVEDDSRTQLRSEILADANAIGLPQQPPLRPAASISTTRYEETAPLRGDDTSSCEYAAHIITSMRGDVNAGDLAAELGCRGDVRGCNVDNVKLFVAMDRYAG